MSSSTAADLWVVGSLGAAAAAGGALALMYLFMPTFGEALEAQMERTMDALAARLPSAVNPAKILLLRQALRTAHGMAVVYASGFRFEWNPEARAVAAVPHSAGPDGRDEYRAAVADALRCAHQGVRVADQWARQRRLTRELSEVHARIMAAGRMGPFAALRRMNDALAVQVVDRFLASMGDLIAGAGGTVPAVLPAVLPAMSGGGEEAGEAGEAAATDPKAAAKAAKAAAEAEKAAAKAAEEAADAAERAAQEAELKAAQLELLATVLQHLSGQAAHVMQRGYARGLRLEIGAQLAAAGVGSEAMVLRCLRALVPTGDGAELRLEAGEVGAKTALRMGMPDVLPGEEAAGSAEDVIRQFEEHVEKEVGAARSALDPLYTRGPAAHRALAARAVAALLEEFPATRAKAHGGAGVRAVDLGADAPAKCAAQ